MSNKFDPAIALEDIVNVLNELEINYFLVGSFASGFRGEFRATNDIDIVAVVTSEKLSRFISLCKPKFYTDEESIPLRLNEQRSFNIIHEETFVKIDFFTKITEFENEQFSLVSILKIPSTGTFVNVSTAEYNIIAKINWYLKSNKVLDRQIADVKSMIAVNYETLDLDYLNKWAEYFGTTEILHSLLD